MEIIYRDLSSIKPNPNNPRKAKPHGVEELAQSIKENPDYFEARPILLSNRTGELIIVGGERRSEAARYLGMDKVPTILIPNLTEERENELMIIDNVHSGVWDEIKLESWDKAKLQKWGVDLPKWEKPAKQVTDDEFNPDEGVITIRCKRGDIWQLGEHRLMCGDSIQLADIQRLIGGGGQIDLLMIDPPYGIKADKMTMGNGKKEFYRGSDWDNLKPNIMPLLNIAQYSCIWGGNYYADILPVNNDWLCWYKNIANMSFSEFELAWTNYGKNCRLLTHNWAGETKLHVTMKPLDVIVWAIQKCPNQTETVCDLFGGSGTTLIACEQLEKKCYMMEIDPHYCDVIIERWEKYTGKTAIKID